MANMARMARMARIGVGAAAVWAGIMLGCQRETGSRPPPAATQKGEQLFRERCAACHPGGGNTLNPRKTLHAGVLADNGITEAKHIVKVLRHPGPGMPGFDPAVISDSDALLIADYVLATFR